MQSKGTRAVGLDRCKGMYAGEARAKYDVVVMTNRSPRSGSLVSPVSKCRMC
jgi:hypothetical protein